MALSTGKDALDLQKNALLRASKKSYGSGVGYVTAKGFLWAAEAGMQHLWEANGTKDATSKIRENRGVIISAAINLSLSAELAIKCLLSAYGLTVPIDHDLLKLYRKLPVDLKIQLSDFYTKNIGSSNCVIHLGALYDNDNKSTESRVIADSLEDAIQHSRRTFNKFRFIHELDSKPETYQADFYFTELRFIVETLLSPVHKSIMKIGFLSKRTVMLISAGQPAPLASMMD